MTDAIERLRAKLPGNYYDQSALVFKSDLRALLDAYDALETVAQGLAEALAIVQWQKDFRSAALIHCACCEVYQSVGRHNKGCSLSAALAAWEGYQR